MKRLKMLAIALVVAGGLGLIYERFSHSKDTREAQVGALTMTVRDTPTFQIPSWASVGAIVAGALILLWSKEYTPMKKPAA